MSIINKPPISIVGDGEENPWYEYGALDGDARRQHYIGRPATGRLQLKFTTKVVLYWIGRESEIEEALKPLYPFIRTARMLHSIANGKKIPKKYQYFRSFNVGDGTSGYYVCTMPDHSTGYGVRPVDGSLVWCDVRKPPMLEYEVQQQLLDMATPDEDEPDVDVVQPEPDVVRRKTGPSVILPVRRRGVAK
jgi:hypothetical protein